MSERIERIKSHLDQTRNHLNGILDQVGERWDTPVYSDGAQWTVHQLAIHLMLSSGGMGILVTRISQGEPGTSPDFDLEKYNRSSVEKRKDKTIEEVRQTLLDDRVKLLTWLDEIEDESVLDHVGRHAIGDMLSVEGFLMVIGDHEVMHAKDIAHVLNMMIDEGE